jgi:hypothetical protein
MSRTAPPATSAAMIFLRTLFDNVPGVLELRALPSAAQRFVSAEDLDAGLAWITEHLDEDVFVGVATWRDDTSGAGENCLALGMLFADIDFKKTPEQDARARIAAFPLPPTMVVAFGGRPARLPRAQGAAPAAGRGRAPGGEDDAPSARPRAGRRSQRGGAGACLARAGHLQLQVLAAVLGDA